jgi:hypothetical protein
MLPVLRYGSVGESVKLLQQALNVGPNSVISERLYLRTTMGTKNGIFLRPKFVAMSRLARVIPASGKSFIAHENKLQRSNQPSSTMTSQGFRVTIE